MVARRKMIAGGLVAGLVGAVIPSGDDANAAAAAGAGAATEAGAGAPMAVDENTPIFQKILEELQLHRPTCGIESCLSLDSIRRQQHTYLRAHGRYPEFIDVGLGPWEDLYAWHIKYQVPVRIGLRADGYYGMPFTLTTIVLKPNMQPDYVGSAYDGSR
jgi:hypothetical protein